MTALRRWRAHLICALTKPWLAAFVDGEIRGRWWARVVVRHLQECPPCADLVEQMRAAKSAVVDSAEPVASPPPSLWPAIEQRIAEAPVRYPARFAPLWVPVGVFLLAAVGITVILVTRRPLPAMAAEPFRRHYVQSLPERHFGEVTVSDFATAEEWLRESVPFACHLMPELTGYTLAQVGTMNGADGRPVAIAAYRKGEDFVAVYAMARTRETPPPWDRQITDYGDLYVAFVGDTYLACWVHEATMYLAVGRRPVARFALDCLEMAGGERY